MSIRTSIGDEIEQQPLNYVLDFFDIVYMLLIVIFCVTESVRCRILSTIHRNGTLEIRIRFYYTRFPFICKIKSEILMDILWLK